ncbi:MAG: type II toxin-antitoxin system VapC family toxin [Armatimonadetes bacterium]|nr:type II toxin-antitoxin system VapC family toxin [Armatimonadota bacterium]
MLLDTTFVIDVQRETLRSAPAGAYRFLADHPDLPMRISVITYGELAEGFAHEAPEHFQELVQPDELIALTSDMAWRFGELSRLLRSEGKRLGDNDLWIAAVALEMGVPLVTRDSTHFERVPGLSVVTY